MKSVLLKGGRVVNPADGFDGEADLFIRNGKIEKIGKNLSVKADGEIDVKGFLVTPGLVDMHVHLREPGFEYKETIATGTRAAVAGGVTSVACMPNTNPPVDDQAIVYFIRAKAEKEGACRVYPIGCLTKGRRGEEMAPLGELHQAGVVAFSDDGSPVMNAELMRRCMEYASMLDLPVIEHCEDLNLSADGCIHEGAVSTRLGLKGIPATSESAMVARNILLAEQTGAKLHLAHLSTAASVDLLRFAKQRGIRVTAETCPHYLCLSERCVKIDNPNFKMNPPLRSEEDVAAVRKALREGVLDAVATDHAPHASTEKQCEFDKAAFGIVGLETLFPVLYEKTVEEGLLSLLQAVEYVTLKPASILKISAGTLSLGAAADIAVFDITTAREVRPQAFAGKGRNTPFQGWKLKGFAVLTLVGGEVRFVRQDAGLKIPKGWLDEKRT